MTPNHTIRRMGASRSDPWQFRHQRRLARTADAARYMKNTHSTFLPIVCLLLLGAQHGWTQQKQVPVRDQSAAPIGTYVPAQNAVERNPLSPLPTNSAPLFSLRLETNGAYFAQTAPEVRATQDGDLVRLLPRSEIARGTWRWDAQKREFQLQPGDLKFYIKSLPVDPQYTNRLVWGSSWLVRKQGN